MRTTLNVESGWFAFDDRFVLCDEIGNALLFDTEAEAVSANYIPSPYFAPHQVTTTGHYVGQAIRVHHQSGVVSDEACILGFLGNGTVHLDRPVLGYRCWAPEQVSAA